MNDGARVRGPSGGRSFSEAIVPLLMSRVREQLCSRTNPRTRFGRFSRVSRAHVYGKRPNVKKPRGVAREPCGSRASARSPREWPAMRLTFLGHAGWLAHTRGGSVLCDPWFNPAYFGSWFP